MFYLKTLISDLTKLLIRSFFFGREPFFLIKRIFVLNFLKYLFDSEKQFLTASLVFLFSHVKSRSIGKINSDTFSRRGAVTHLASFTSIASLSRKAIALQLFIKKSKNLRENMKRVMSILFLYLTK